MKLIEKFVALLAWVQIMVTPFFGGVIIGFLNWLTFHNTRGMIVGIAISLLGLVLGIVWAEKERKKKGTVNFMSRVNASPELDAKDEEENQK
jgi:hypothetical protein